MKPKLIIFDLFGTLVFSVEKLKREDFFAFYQKLGIKFKTEKDIKLFTSLFAQLMTQSAGWQDFSHYYFTERFHFLSPFIPQIFFSNLM